MTSQGSAYSQFKRPPERRNPALRIEDRPAFKRPDKKVRWLF